MLAMAQGDAREPVEAVVLLRVHGRRPLAPSGQAVDAFDVGDIVTVVDQELGIRESQRVLKVVHDVARPWAYEDHALGQARASWAVARPRRRRRSTSGSTSSTFDLVPYNLLKNGRFDNRLAHWASSGATIVRREGNGRYAVRFAGGGTRWIEQTVQPDNRDVYSLSLDVTSSEAGVVPKLRAIATCTTRTARLSRSRSSWHRRSTCRARFACRSASLASRSASKSPTRLRPSTLRT